MIGLHAAAAAAGLAGPPLLGNLVQSVQEGTTISHVDKVIALLALFLVAETILTWFARRASFVLSEKIFAELREQVPGYQTRQLVRPGITGWAQVNQKYDTSIDDVRRKVSFDLEYVARRSLFEDLRILARTVPVVLNKGGW